MFVLEQDTALDIGALEFVNETLQGPKPVSSNPPPPGGPPRPTPGGGGVR